MVIPVGPPGQHVILKIVKQQNADGSIRVARSNVYNKVVPFVAFTKLDGERVKGTHDSTRGRTPAPPGAPPTSRFWPF
jgi:protein-L-isoaspartate(D-aspartate) O-methyltransferase